MKRLSEEKGVVLVIALMFLLVLGLLGMGAISTTSHDNRISGNKRISDQAFYAAEAGVQEVMGRFRPDATGEIEDTEPLNPNWRRFIALNQDQAAKVGYVSSNSNHMFLQSLQTRLDFAVELRHKVNIANAVVTREGHPVYLMTSLGVTSEGGQKRIEAELNPCPSLNPGAAIYSEMPVDLSGSSTYLQGMDACGTNNVAGVATTLPQVPTDPVTIHGSPTVQGDPPVQYDTSNRSMREMVDYLRKDANFAYAYGSNQTLTGMSDQWGIPSGSGTTNPLNYSGPLNIVYFNMNGHTLKLAGGSHGAGILLVDGNLELNGGFLWYGLIIVTGALDFTGGGEKNITGGVMTGESATVEVDIGGNAAIIHCSAVQPQLEDRVTPVRMTRWREVY